MPAILIKVGVILCTGLQLNVSVLGSQVNALDLVSNGEVASFFTTALRVMTLASIYPDLVLPGGLSPIPIHMQLDKSALQEVNLYIASCMEI